MSPSFMSTQAGFDKMNETLTGNAFLKPFSARRRAISKAVRATLGSKPIEMLEGRVLFSQTVAFGPTLANVTPAGNVSIETTDFHSGINGTALFVSNGAASNGGSSPVSATLGVQNYKTVPSGTTNGSGTLTLGTFSANTGDTFAINYDFLTTESSSAASGFNDTAVAYLYNTSGNVVATQTLGSAGGTLGTTGKLDSLSSGFLRETGFTSVPLIAPSTGTFGVGIAVVNVGDTHGTSAVLVNSIVAPQSPTSVAFDFGTASSSIAAGYTQVTNSTPYTAGSFGWVSTAGISGLDTNNLTTFGTLSTDLTRDFNYTSSGTFQADVASGVYDVTVVVGDPRGYGYKNSITLNGGISDTIGTGAFGSAAVVSKTYVVSVTSGPLVLGLSGSNGAGSLAQIEGLSIVPDTTPLTNFDFGSTTSPIATGYKQVTPTTTYNASSHFGWYAGSANPVLGFDTGSTASFAGVSGPIDPNITRDFNYTKGAVFDVDIAQGTYNVTLTLGDARNYSYTNNISFNGIAVDSVQTGGGNGAIVQKSYVVAVGSNGQLQVGLSGAGGNYAQIEGLTIDSNVSTNFVIASSNPASGAMVNGISSATITFNHPLAAGITASNFALSSSNSNGITVVSVVPSGPNSLGQYTETLNFSSPLTAANYTITTSGITDSAGNTLKSPTSISFVDAIPPAPTAFDFGTSNSPVAAGYTGVTNATAYNGAYGWTSVDPNVVKSADTGSTTVFSGLSTSLTRDFVYTTNDTFEVNVGQGTYNVTLVVGDPRGYGYTNNILFNDGSHYTVLTGGGAGHQPAVVSATFAVTVGSNGLMTVNLTGNGSSPYAGIYAQIEGLSFVKTS